MEERLESKFDFKILAWLLPVAPFFFVPLILLIKKINGGFYYWEQLGYYFILPVFISIAFWVVTKFLLKMAPKVIIYPNHLEINGKQIPFDQIAKIRLFTPSKSVSDCSSVVLKNGSEFKIGISLYKNGTVLRTNLKKIKDNLLNPDNSITIQPQIFPLREYQIKDFREFNIFKKSIFSSLQTYIIWPAILFFFYLLLIKFNGVTLALFLIFGIMLGFILIFQAFYFLISAEYFTIKNAYLPYWQKSYSRTDIIKTDHIYGTKSADGIKLTFSNFKTMGYLSCLLTSSMFSELEKQLNKDLKSTVV